MFCLGHGHGHACVHSFMEVSLVSLHVCANAMILTLFADPTIGGREDGE